MIQVVLSETQIRYGHKTLQNYCQLKVIKSHKTARVYFKF